MLRNVQREISRFTRLLYVRYASVTVLQLKHYYYNITIFTLGSHIPKRVLSPVHTGNKVEFNTVDFVESRQTRHVGPVHTALAEGSTAN